MEDLKKILSNYPFYIYLIIGWILYSQSLHFDFFLFDDLIYLQENKRILNPTLDNILGYWGESRMALSFNIWQLISIFWGVETPYAFRIVAILFHSLNALLAFYVIRDLFKKIVPKIIPGFKSPDNNIPYILGGLLFLLHPLCVESIVWISSNKHLFSSSFALGSMLYYLKSVDHENEDKAFYSRMISFVLYILSIFASPISASIFLLYIICDIAILNRKSKNLIIENMGYIILFIVVWKSYEGNKDFIPFETFSEGIAHILFNLKHYFLSIVAPLKLQFIYPYTSLLIKTTYKTGFNFLTLVFVGFSLFSFVLFSINRKKFHLTALSVLLYLVIIAPGLGFVRVEYNRISLVSDRFSYLALIAIGFFVAALYIKIKDNKWLLKAFFSYLVVIGLLSFQQVGYWKHEKELFSGRKDLEWHKQRMTIHAFHLMKKREYEEAENFLLHAAPYRTEALNHLVTLYKEWGNKIKIRSFLNNHFPKFSIQSTNLSMLYMPDLASLFLIIGDIPNFTKIYDFIKINSHQFGKETLSNLDKLLNEYMKNEPFSSFLILGDYFTHKGNFDLAEEYYIRASKFDEKFKIVAPRLRRIKNIKDLQNMSPEERERMLNNSPRPINRPIGRPINKPAVP